MAPLFCTHVQLLINIIFFFVVVSGTSSSSSSFCNLNGIWNSVGGDDPVTVIQPPTSSTFVASAASGWTNVSGYVSANNNGTVYLNCCKHGGIYGTILDTSTCSFISWDDGEGSQWQKQPTPVFLPITLSNIKPRVDDTGEILRVQDGCIAQFGQLYYLYGARYQCCPVDEQPQCYQECGWRNTTFAVYSSPDMQTWHLESENILPVSTDPTSPYFNGKNAYFEPCVLYSADADHYVLWFLLEFTKAVAVSDYPTGPFESVSWDVGLQSGSDSYYWVDSVSGRTYMKHNGPPPPGEIRGSHYVSRLALDLLSIDVNATSEAMMVPALPVPPYYQGTWPSCSEGGGIFAVNGTWFVMAGACCCFCSGGANAYVWTATDPLGPYTLQVTGTEEPGNVIPFNVSTNQYLTGAQQFSVAQMVTSSGVVPMYVGQRFGSALDGVKCHDFQYWSPLTTSIVNGSVVINEMSWLDEFTLDLQVFPGNATSENNKHNKKSGEKSPLELQLE